MSKSSILPKLVALTPHEVYLQQVKATFDAMRYSGTNLAYLPPQFGGIFGQNLVANSGAVLEIISFDIET